MVDDSVKISIGGNFNQDNYKQFPRLLDYMIKSGLSPERLGAVKFDPVVRRPENDRTPVEYIGGCMSLYDPWLIEAEAFLRDEILKRGYYTHKPQPGICMVETKGSYVVNVDGTLYKCPGFIGQRGFEAGHLTTGPIDYSKAYHLEIWKNSKCEACVYLPFCFGGCRYMSFIYNGSIGKIDCRKDYYDAALERLIKQDLWYQKGIDCR